MEAVFFKLANSLSEQIGNGQLYSTYSIPMKSDEQGYSGAKLVRLNCIFSSGKMCSYICKYATLSERMVMQTLTKQKREHSPYSYSDLQETDETAWFIMQDIRSCETLPCNISTWKKQVAAALADIHTDNFGSADKTPYLLHANEDYWKYITTKISVDHFEKKCVLDNSFAAQYSNVLPKLRKLAERFVKDMTELYQDGTSITITHGDLQNISGDHVRCFKGKPMIIDWGFSRLAPFYIDLVDYFTQEEAMLYLEALQYRNIKISKRDFEECYHMASLYPVFIYLYPALVQYDSGKKEKLYHLLSILSKHLS